MNLISEVRDSDIGISNELNHKNEYKIRNAVRAVLFNKEKKIAMLYVEKHGYHKLPGGGIETGEDLLDALRRECEEEVGAKIEIEKEIGYIVEYRNEHNLKHTSYCFYAHIVGELTLVRFTEEEKNNGFELKWLDLQEAIEQMKSDKPDDYVGKFINIRDTMLLKEALKNLY